MTESEVQKPLVKAENLDYKKSKLSPMWMI